MTRGSVVLVVGALMLAGLGFARSGGELSRDVDLPPPALPVRTVALEAVTSFAQRRTFTGVLRAARVSELGFERTGRLIAVGVTEGDRVDPGQLLARLDTENLQARQRELAAQRAAAQSLLEELEAGPRQETIAAARAEVKDWQSQVELADLGFQRRERLLASRATSQEDYESATLGLQSARARLEASQRRLDELEAGTRVERIDAQRAVVAQLDASLANTAIDIEESLLRAPFAGRIGQRYVDEGTIVAPGTPLLRLVEDAQLEAWIGLPAGLADQLHAGQRVELVVAQRDYTATLRTVLPELDPTTRTRTAIFQLTTSAVVPGQVVRVEIAEQVDAAGFWLPTTALARGSRGLWSVLVVEPPAGDEASLAVKRNVEVLHTDGRRALIRGTLQPGDQVIVMGTHRVVAGQAVTATPLAEDSH